MFIRIQATLPRQRVTQWSRTERIVLFDVDIVVKNKIDNASRLRLVVHNILTTVMMNIAVDNSTHHTKSLSIR